MGMFDSLILEAKGQRLAIQSKRFARMLAEYNVGDSIEGAEPGVRVYFHHCKLDESGRLVYGADARVAISLTIFVVVAHGVFVEYQVIESTLPDEAVKNTLQGLRERWQDTARMQDLLIESLREKQAYIAQLNAQLQRVRSVLSYAAQLKTEGHIDNRFLLLHEEIKRLADGEDPLAVLDWLLNCKTEQPGVWQCDPRVGELDEFQL